MSQPFTAKPTLRSRTVELRSFSDCDLPAIVEALSDPDVRRLTGSVHDAPAAHAPIQPAHYEQLCQWYLTRAEQPDRMDLAIVERATGQCVGEAVLNQYDPGNRSCNFRILLGPPGQGRGLGTEATRLLVGYGFEELRLHRISLEVYDFNPRARRAYEKVGFRAEGTLRESLRYENRWIDATVMSILAHEWAVHHGQPDGGPAPSSTETPSNMLRRTNPT
ncbi:GNAT family N-acetyltransferase [Nocardia sp. NPDC058058]|uniref:GNAT family N-acetyltransferase n=1 Tax=Nocardia sp. NPDC058058 TaxID=3346317 RepID=UPI0036DAAACE